MHVSRTKIVVLPSAEQKVSLSAYTLFDTMGTIVSVVEGTQSSYQT
jgi:hypothetical protein